MSGDFDGLASTSEEAPSIDTSGVRSGGLEEMAKVRCTDLGPLGVCCGNRSVRRCRRRANSVAQLIVVADDEDEWLRFGLE